MIAYVVYWSILISSNSLQDTSIDVWGHRSYQNRRYEKIEERHSAQFEDRDLAISFYQMALNQKDLFSIKLDSITIPHEDIQPKSTTNNLNVKK